jgi:ABC-type nitrate/sulfonate/bicarbonate transport system permease component
MFMGASRGMGQSIMESYSIYDLTTMYAYIAAVGVVGFALNAFCVIGERRASRWAYR